MFKIDIKNIAKEYLNVFLIWTSMLVSFFVFNKCMPLMVLTSGILISTYVGIKYRKFRNFIDISVSLGIFIIFSVLSYFLPGKSFGDMCVTFVEGVFTSISYYSSCLMLRKSNRVEAFNNKNFGDSVKYGTILGIISSAVKLVEIYIKDGCIFNLSTMNFKSSSFFEVIIEELFEIVCLFLFVYAVIVSLNKSSDMKKLKIISYLFIPMVYQMFVGANTSNTEYIVVHNIIHLVSCNLPAVWLLINKGISSVFVFYWIVDFSRLLLFGHL